MTRQQIWGAALCAIFSSVMFLFSAAHAGTRPLQTLPGKTAAEQLATALDQAKSEGKLVFLRFSSTGCSHCERMDRVLTRIEMKSIFGQEFVDLEINLSTEPQARQLYLKYAKKEEGVPWFAFLETSGIALANSVGPSGNIGCPESNDEIRFFIDMIKKNTKTITNEQLSQIEDAFKKSY